MSKYMTRWHDAMTWQDDTNEWNVINLYENVKNKRGGGQKDWVLQRKYGGGEWGGTHNPYIYDTFFIWQ